MQRPKQTFIETYLHTNNHQGYSKHTHKHPDRQVHTQTCKQQAFGCKERCLLETPWLLARARLLLKCIFNSVHFSLFIYSGTTSQLYKKVN